jgi:hypothetical protein
MDEQPRPDQEEDLPRPAPESGLPGGSNSVVGDKVPAGSSESEDIRENVVGGPEGGTHGDVAPRDEHGSKLGASAAMGGPGDSVPGGPGGGEGTPRGSEEEAGTEE